MMLQNGVRKLLLKESGSFLLGVVGSGFSTPSLRVPVKPTTTTIKL
jgi:hypothetical protein